MSEIGFNVYFWHLKVQIIYQDLQYLNNNLKWADAHHKHWKKTAEMQEYNRERFNMTYTD